MKINNQTLGAVETFAPIKVEIELESKADALWFLALINAPNVDLHKWVDDIANSFFGNRSDFLEIRKAAGKLINANTSSAVYQKVATALRAQLES